MSEVEHKIYIFTMVGIVVVVVILMAILGIDYYTTDIEQRFFHEQNETLKPSGFVGHGVGIIGSLLMIVGVFGYMARKRFRSLSQFGALKYWLEFHIFLCTLGPVLVLYHTAFKFGGIAGISFWSMVLIVISGALGRFIYLQIPRTIEGHEISLTELNEKKAGFNSNLRKQFKIDDEFVEFLNHTFSAETGLYEHPSLLNLFKRFSYERELINSVKSELNVRNVSNYKFRKIVRFVHAEIVLNRRIAWLSVMQKYLKYWHVVHLPLALTMLVIMLVHVIVAVLFGYTWIL